MTREISTTGPEFHPTHEELFVLAKYWATEYLRSQWYWFRTRMASSTYSAWDAIARRRVELIATIIREEALEKALGEVVAECRHTVSHPRWWRIFWSGTPEEWDDVYEEFENESYGQLGYLFPESNPPDDVSEPRDDDLLVTQSDAQVEEPEHDWHAQWDALERLREASERDAPDKQESTSVWSSRMAPPMSASEFWSHPLSR